jgi:hypothetical protein
MEVGGNLVPPSYGAPLEPPDEDPAPLVAPEVEPLEEPWVTPPDAPDVDPLLRPPDALVIEPLVEPAPALVLELQAIEAATTAKNSTLPGWFLMRTLASWSFGFHHNSAPARNLLFRHAVSHS